MIVYDDIVCKYIAVDEEAAMECINRLHKKVEEAIRVMHRSPCEELLAMAKETATEKVREKGYFTPVDLAMWLAFTEEAANKACNRIFGKNYKVGISNPSVWKNTIEFVFEDLRRIADEGIITVDKVMRAYKWSRCKALTTLPKEEKVNKEALCEDIMRTGYVTPGHLAKAFGFECGMDICQWRLRSDEYSKDDIRWMLDYFDAASSVIFLPNQWVSSKQIIDIFDAAIKGINEVKETRTMKREEMIESATENISKILDRSYEVTPKGIVRAFVKAGFTCQDNVYDAIINEVIFIHPDEMSSEVVDRVAELFCKKFLESNTIGTEIVKVDHVSELLNDAIVQAKHECSKPVDLDLAKSKLYGLIIDGTLSECLDDNICLVFNLDLKEYGAAKKDYLESGEFFTNYSDFTREEWKEVVDEMIDGLENVCAFYGSYESIHVIINLEGAIRSMRIKKAKKYLENAIVDGAHPASISRAFGFEGDFKDAPLGKQYADKYYGFTLNERISLRKRIVAPALSKIENTRDISVDGVYGAFLDALEDAEANEKPDGIYVTVTEEWFVDERRINKSYISVTAEINKKDIEDALVKYGYSKTFGTDTWEALTIYAAGEIAVRKKTNVTLSDRYCEIYPYPWSYHCVSPFNTFDVDAGNITISDVFNIIERNYRIRSYNKVDGTRWCLLVKGQDVSFPVIVIDEVKTYEDVLKLQEKVAAIGEESIVLPTEAAYAEGFYFDTHACWRLLKKLLKIN